MKDRYIKQKYQARKSPQCMDGSVDILECICENMRNQIHKTVHASHVY